MKLATLRYVQGRWSGEFPDLDSEQTLVLAFGAPGYGEQPDVLERLVAAYPRSAVIGCSTAGEIDQTRIRDESITVAIARFERSKVRRAQARLVSAGDSYRAGGEIAEQLQGPELRAVFVLSKGVDVNG